jgi:nucleoside-diphosphate-sugar epimerase
VTSPTPPGRVLVAGVSGVVGFAAAHHFSMLGWDVLGLSRRRPARLDHVEHVSVDLADADSVRAAADRFDGITHVVYAALFEKPGLVAGWRERDQMERNRLMLANLYEALSDTAELRHVSLLQGTKAYGAHIEPMAVPGRERNPRHRHENFYWLQEDYLRERQAADGGWHWTILRPQVIYGEAQGGNMNALPAFGVYAALLRADGRPLDFPGGVAPISEAVDADLVARMLAWAATEPAAADEVFNVTNGDVYSLRNVWPVVADAFGMEVGADVPASLAETMPPREADWARLVERFALTAPTSLGAFVGQSFIYADLVSGYGQTRLRSPSLLSTVKARHAGFADCVDTEDMFARLIANLQQARLLPPRRW